jgi:hypothetical protein
MESTTRLPGRSLHSCTRGAAHVEGQRMEKRERTERTERSGEERKSVRV